MSIWQLMLGVSLGVVILFLLIRSDRDSETHVDRDKQHDNRGSWIALLAGAVILLFIIRKDFRERFVTWVEDKLHLHHNEESSEDKDAIHARKTRPTPKQETPPSAETAYQGKPDMHGRVEATEEDLKHWTASNPDVKVVG